MKELTLEITNKCYQGCAWCSSSSIPNGKHMSYQKILHLLRKYRAECDVVRISGGEPTLHPSLLGVLKYAKILGYTTVLLTSGWEMNKVIGCDLVDEYVINIVSDKSILEVFILHHLDKKVSTEVVLAERNEDNIAKATKLSMESKIPLRLLVLQNQGRAKINHVKPLTLVGWTGDRGCRKDNKITITPDGKIVTCSALKYGECSLEVK